MSLLSERMTERMTGVSMTQADLARAIGVSQQAIGKLVNGKTRSTSHIGVLARALQTTVSYLSGETDDPDEGAPPPPPKPNVQLVTMQVALPDVGQLERMFLDVLKASEGMSPEALAHELALLLPKKLALLQLPIVFQRSSSAHTLPAGAEDDHNSHSIRRRA